MDISNLKKAIDQEIAGVKTEDDVFAFHQKFLSKSGEITKLMAGIKDIAPEKRGEFGKTCNAIKQDTETRLFKIQDEIKAVALREKLMSDPLVDITIPRLNTKRGTLHPITIVTRDVEEVLERMGFIVEEGNEIATEFENFESINIPKHHPARDMQDTFWLSDGRVLRTHTSMWQNYMMKKYGPSFRAICPGRCFRNEATDATHENTFFQVEGMMVGKDISIANLLYFMKEITTALLKRDDIEVRLRPSYFPFTEPSFEMDATCVFCDGKGCPICKHSGWIELFPCGMIHPRVLEMGGINPKEYRGFAFGFGLTRLAMLRWGIKDIRMFNSGNLDFLAGVTK
ncbi:MAG: phenylalanine--tRNA ligase subunit alpha [Firmicutes bacterium]|nr:phenylalanine--tRNA ligase subunit alpha [Bacillota bacterium]